MLMNLLKFSCYGLAIAVLLPPLIALFFIASFWSISAFVAFLAFL